MNREDFLLALEVMAKYHTTELTFNKPINNFVGDLGEKKFTIHITKCCASVVDSLKNHGFSLSMEKYGLSVNKH